MPSSELSFEKKNTNVISRIQEIKLPIRGTEYHYLFVSWVTDIRQKLEELTRLYYDIQNNCHDRSRALEDALGVSEKFWEDLNILSGSIKELQEGLATQEKPALEPEAIREQQEELEVRECVCHA